MSKREIAMDYYRDSDRWPAYVVPWDDTAYTDTDVSFLLHKPAGVFGFIRSRDGHFVLDNGERFKIWGTNMTLSAPMPISEDAPKMARRMAKYGLNCVRLHHIDHRWPEGLLIRHSSGTPAPIGRDLGAPNDGRDESTRALDPEALARLDWFVHCLKNEGIYIDLNLHVSRQFTAADGIAEAELTGFGKAITYFNRRAIELQKEYARQILTHVNPFTGLSYADEPAVALIELLNENSLTAYWMRDKLHGGNRMGETWGNIPDSYEKELSGLYNAHLLKQYKTRDALKVKWGGELLDDENPTRGTVRRTVNAKADPQSARFLDEAAFYQSVEAAYFTEMRAFLRDELGAKQLVVGTSDCFFDCGSLSMTQAQTCCDVIDGHAYYNSYWDTPNLRRNQRSAREWYSDWHLRDDAMIEAPETSMPAKLSRDVVMGFPYIVSEINEHFPGCFASECLPINTAYALLQDWDGIFWFGYAGTDWEGVFQFDERLPLEARLIKTQAITRFEWMCNDPMKMLQTAFCALMFLRGDVDQAQGVIARHMSRADVLGDTVRIAPDSCYYGRGAISPMNSLLHRVEIADYRADDTHVKGPVERDFSSPLVSDTGQARWFWEGKRSKVIVSSPRQIALVGFSPEHKDDRLSISGNVRFGAVQIASLTDEPIEQTTRALILACSHVANTGMKCMQDRCSLGDQFGGPPTRVETFDCSIELVKVRPGIAFMLTALDGTGTPIHPPVRLESGVSGLSIPLHAADGTILYSLTREA